jgi:hypothetical protein
MNIKLNQYLNIFHAYVTASKEWKFKQPLFFDSRWYLRKMFLRKWILNENSAIKKGNYKEFIHERLEEVSRKLIVCMIFSVSK